jgi:hypothetical protein
MTKSGPKDARERFRQCPLGTWASYLGGGHDNNIGMRVTFLEDGSGTMEEWGFDELYDSAYVSEPKFQWRNLGERKIEITHRGQPRAVEYDFKITENEYGVEELRMFESGRKPDERGEIGFWVSPFSLVHKPKAGGIIQQLWRGLKKV